MSELERERERQRDREGEWVSVCERDREREAEQQHGDACMTQRVQMGGAVKQVSPHTWG